MTSNNGRSQQKTSPSELEQNLKSAVDKTYVVFNVTFHRFVAFFRMNLSNEVKGLVCCNSNGDLLTSAGTMNEDSAAIISHLSKLVSELENEDPGKNSIHLFTKSLCLVIQLEGKESRVLIHKRADVIVGIHKTLPETTANGS